MTRAPRFSLTPILCAAVLVMLTGCFFNGDPNRTPLTRSDINESIAKEPEWSKVPALRRIPISSELFLARSVRPPLPDTVAGKKISLRFAKGDATLQDLISILDTQGIPLVFRTSGETGLSEDDLGDMVLPFRRYDGTVAGLAKKLANSLDLAVWWENDALYISDRDRYVISVPQNADVINNVIKELEDFGAEDVTSSMYGGRIVYSVRPAVNEELIKPYLNGLIGNLSEITLQLAVVQLSLSDAAERGIDWSSFQLQFGDPSKITSGVLKSVTNTSASGSTNIISSSSSGTSGTISGVLKTRTGAGNTLGVSAAMLYLSQFGRTSTQQMVELRTLAGMRVQLQSLHTTPYVKGISSTTSTASSSNNVTSSVDTASVDTGLSMAFTPYYDSVLGLVSVNVNIQISSLIELKKLEYNGGGSTTASAIFQPETQKNQINDIVRLPAGEVVILGGLKQDIKKDNRQSPFDLYDALGSKKTDNETSLIFFIMRPVVTIFDPKGATVNTTLPGAPSDQIDRAFHDDTEAQPVTVIDPLVQPPRRKEEEDVLAPLPTVISLDNHPAPTIIKSRAARPADIMPKASADIPMGHTVRRATEADVPPSITQIDGFVGGEVKGGP